MPVYLVQQGRVPSATAIDINSGPYESALTKVTEQNLRDKITVLLGDGFDLLHVGQVEAAVLAGMGSSTMIGVLEAKPEVTASLKQLVLQPMAGAAQIRKWLADNGWMIEDEVMIEDDGFIYFVLSAVPGRQVIADWLSLELGPVNLHKKPLLLKVYINKMLTDYESILLNLERAKSKKAEGKRSGLFEKINLLRGVLRNDFKS